MNFTTQVPTIGSSKRKKEKQIAFFLWGEVPERELEIQCHGKPLKNNAEGNSYSKTNCFLIGKKQIVNKAVSDRTTN